MGNLGFEEIQYPSLAALWWKCCLAIVHVKEPREAGDEEPGNS